MRKTDSRHNARLSTSWRDVISHSPRTIPLLTVRCERQPFAATAKSNKVHNQEATNVSPEAGSHAAARRRDGDLEQGLERRVESGEQPVRRRNGTVLWTVRAGEEPPLHTHSREDELLYVVQGKLIARVGDARVEVGPGAYAALPRGVPHTIEVVGDQATLLLNFVPGGLERFLVPRKGEKPDPAAFGLTFP
jgi:quercetin dioxygenase-like cupin family protein